MEWFDGLLNIAGTASAGPWGAITGLAGGLVGGIFKYFKSKQEHKFKQDEWAHEVNLQELQMKARAAETEQELAITAQQGSWSALNESMKTQKAAGASYRWVNAVKDLYRPILTTGLFLMTWFIYASTEDMELKQYIVYSVTYAACTAGAWWFADRAMAPPGMKNR